MAQYVLGGACPSCMIHEVQGRCWPVRSTCEGQGRAGNRRVCRWPSAIRMKSSSYRHSVPMLFTTGWGGVGMLRWSVWHEREAQSICPVGPARRISLQGHSTIVKSNILLLGSDGLWWTIWIYNGTFDLKSKQEPTQWNNKTGVKLSYQITCITFTKHLLNSSPAGGQTVVLFG